MADAINKWKAINYHSIRFYSSAISIVCGAGALFIALPISQTYIAGLALLLSYAITILKETPISIFQKNNRNDIFFQTNLFSSAVGVIAFSLSYIPSTNLSFGLVCYAAAKIVSYLFDRWKLAMLVSLGRVSLRPNFSMIRSMLVVAIPLGFTALIGSLFTSIPRILIQKELGENSLAVYAVLTSLLVGFNLLVNSFVQSALPNLALDYKENYSRFILKIRTAVYRIIILSIGAIGAGYWYGDIILELIFGHEYSLYKEELILVFFSGAMLSIFSISNLMLSAQNSFTVQFAIYACCAGAIYLAAQIGISSYGLKGGILSQAVGYTIGFGLSFTYFYWKRKNLRATPHSK